MYLRNEKIEINENEPVEQHSRYHNELQKTVLRGWHCKSDRNKEAEVDLREITAGKLI